MRGKNPYGKARMLSKMKSKSTPTLYSAGKTGPEIHVYDLKTVASRPDNTAQVVIDLTGAIAQGDNASSRNGQKICLKSVDIKGSINVASFSANATNPLPVNCWVDVLLVLDKQPNGSVPTAAQIFEDSTTTHTPIAIEYLSRFEVLSRTNHALTGTGGIGAGAIVDLGITGGIINIHKKMNLPTRFNDATGPATTNGVYLVFLTSNSGSTTTVMNVDIDSYARLRFTDS